MNEKTLLEQDIDLEIRFAFPVIPGEQTQEDAQLKDVTSATRQLAYIIKGGTPPCREQSLALTKLEEAMFWARAAIERDR